MSCINKKLEEVFTKLSEKIDKLDNTLNEKVSNLERKLDGVSARINSLDIICQEKWDEMQTCLNHKADNTEVERLHARIATLEEAKKEQDKASIIRESYEKRCNILIHGIPEPSENAWETPFQTLGQIQNFLKKGLCFDDPAIIPLADYHRLPQRPIFDRNGDKIVRPIIIKLTNVIDKRKIFNNLKNLKTFNDERRKNNQSSIYITEHLPKQFQIERKLLLPFFKEAKRRKQKMSWKAENGHYFLYIDGIKVNLPTFPTDIDSVTSDSE